MWYNYFLGFITIITIIRLGLIAAGSMSAQEKVSKASYWLIGLVMISISWAVLGKVFGTNVGKVVNGRSGSSEPHSSPNSDDYETGGYFQGNNQTKTDDPEAVKIKINTETN